MVEEEVRRGFGPLLAVLNSDGVEQTLAKNNLTFAQLLLPFCAVESEVKDPNGSCAASRLILDVRDIRREGFLLSLTVLPSVLHEVVQSVASTSDATAVFREALLHWAEPADHEFLRTYIACLFAVSTEDTDPLNELSQLIQLQHSQQHATSSASAIGPAYCAHPKWMFPNTYKYHILLHDVTSGDESRTSEIFASMCSMYGSENCHLLRLNSGESDGLEDVWKGFLEKKNRGLKSGLDRAKRNVLSKAAPSLIAEDVLVDGDLRNALGDSFDNGTPVTQHGAYLNATDREGISVLVKEFTSNSLIPFVERQLRTMNEQVTARRGISRSLTTGVRKWFGAAAVQSSNPTTVSYSLESNEMQTRRFADLCFMFGLHTFAHQLYQSLKKTFAVDQAWLHHAGALEMAALSTFLSNPQLSAKHYPQHYMENALNHYTTTCMRPILAMRAALISALVLSELNLHVEAASQLLKLTTLENDLFCGILLERSSVAFGNAKMLRKMAFHYILAGHRYFKAEQVCLALESYKTAFSEYAKKRWFFAEDHILYILARDSRSNDAAFEYSKELFRPFNIQPEEQQRRFLTRLLELMTIVCSSKGLPLYIPSSIILAKLVYVLYGGYPEQLKLDFTKGLCSEASFKPVFAFLPTLESGVETWHDLEKAAFYYFFGSSGKFVPVPSATDAFADYSVVRITPLNEHMRVRILIRNYLGFDVVLKNLCLSVDCNSVDLEKSSIHEVSLKSLDDWMEIELSVVPRKKISEFHINGISFNFDHGELSLNCRVPISPGTFESPFQRKDTLPSDPQHCRISSKVLALPYPLIQIELSPSRHVNAFCGQIYSVDFDLRNEGPVAVKDLCLVTNRPTVVSLYEPRHSEDGKITSWINSEHQFSSTNRNVIIFHPKLETIPVGGIRKLRLAFHAPLNEVKSFPLLLLFYYSADNGMCRQERRLILFDTHQLLDASLNSLTDLGDLCLLKVRNLISMRDSLLAKVNLLGIRSLQKIQKTPALSIERSVCLKVIKNRPVNLECEQSDNICFSVTMGVHSSNNDVVWFSNSAQEFPSWPVLPNLHLSSSSSSSVVQSTLPNKMPCQFGVLWKANIVNTDGTVANVLGENMVEYFYRPEAVACLPDSLSCLSLFEKTVSRTQMDQNSTNGSNAEYDLPLVCSVKVSTNTISHDFSSEKLCQFPVEVIVKNNDRLQRDCDLTLHCITPGESTSFVNGNASQNEGQETLSSTTPFAPSTSPVQFVSTISQPLIISNCARLSASLSCGSTHTFKLYLSVASASVYNITCFELSARFQGALETVRVALPYTFVAVVDRSAKPKR